MNQNGINFWAKTLPDGSLGISVRDHCLNVGCVAEALISELPASVRQLLPSGAASLAALHDVGKITLGFQIKAPQWGLQTELTPQELAEAHLSVSDHALVSQIFLQNLLTPANVRLWAVAVGAHHGRPKGRIAKPAPESRGNWAEERRRLLADEIQKMLGDLPVAPPDLKFNSFHSDLWLLAGLITVADWIGSNEAFFSQQSGASLEDTRRFGHCALHTIGWPGGTLRASSFPAAFASGHTFGFQANPLQQAVAEIAPSLGVIVIEGPMGCGKTEAALFAAQQLIAAGQNQGIYFALPTQVTSNRIHKRIGPFLRNNLTNGAYFRLAHANAWLEDDFDLHLQPSYPAANPEDQEDVSGNLREARSWFATSKQALLAPYGVGTIDQALQGVVAVKHFFVRRFALAGKVVILDEVHSYDIYTGTLITALIRELINLRCTVIILSATLTANRRSELLAAAGVGEQIEPDNYPLITVGGVNGIATHISPEWTQHKSLVLRAESITESETVEALIARAEAGQHVLWIRNTVVEAQRAFRAICSTATEGKLNIGLLHSRFPFQRRAELENEWLERLGRNRSSDGVGSVLIATQVVEQSVDIDLDFIVSDLAPTDMVLQRMGRLWRHERPVRAAIKPEFWLRLPFLANADDVRELKRAIGRSAYVYAPYVLLRTASVFSGKTALTLPDDIRSLLEATYAQPVEAEPAGWGDLHCELEQEKATLMANAEAATRVLGNPMLSDEDGVLTRRKGPPTVPVVLLRAVAPSAKGQWLLTALDGSSAIVSEYEWRIVSARFLHRWLVRVPRWMIPGDAPKPRWLAQHTTGNTAFALVSAENGHCLFGDEISSVTYDPRLGIFAERPAKPTPQRNDDDEFDC